MHNTIKDVAADKEQSEALGVPIGAHILTTVIEGDGAVALASDKASFETKVISTQRTASGGIQIQAAVWVKEPAPVMSESAKSADQRAAEFLATKGFTPEAAAEQVKKFGASRVLAKQAAEEAASDKQLDAELDALLSSESGAQQ